jgi:hypothetical protein
VGGGAGGGPLAVPGAVQVIGDVAGMGVDGGRDLSKPFSGLVGAQPRRVVRGFERWHDRVPLGSDRDDVAELVAAVPVGDELVEAVLFEGPGVV